MRKTLFRTNALAVAMGLVLQVAPGHATDTAKEADMTRIIFKVGQDRLAATLDDSPAARDFAGMLPLTLTLSDYHGIEKVGDLGRALDSSGMPDSYEPKAGDITQYAPWKNLAIFVAPFSDSRGLVRLGQFDGDFTALTKVGELTVTIEQVD